MFRSKHLPKGVCNVFVGNVIRGTSNYCVDGDSIMKGGFVLTQGTVSVFIGCHSIIHSLLVLFSWRRLYGEFPELWQTVCIFLHDVGHVGRNYLDSYEEKRTHWMLGAYIAGRLFGWDGYLFIAGHCTHSGYPKNRLYYADKYSWSVAPYWWLYWNSIVEPKLNCGIGIDKAIKLFQKQTKQSIDSGEYKSTHSMYLDRCGLNKNKP